MGDLTNANLARRLIQMKKGKERKGYQRQYYEEKTKLKRRFQQLKKTYGITENQFNAILSYQGDKCGICRIDEPRRGWVLDHCHATGQIRGILCHHCNHVLGFARDNKDTLQSAYFYLERNGHRPSD